MSWWLQLGRADTLKYYQGLLVKRRFYFNNMRRLDVLWLLLIVASVIMVYFIGSSVHKVSSHKIQMPALNHTKVEDDSPPAPSPSPIQVSDSDTHNTTKISVATKPQLAESLPPGIREPYSDFYLHRLQGDISEDLVGKQKYLLALAVGYKQKDIVDETIMKFSENFSIVLFHYDGRTSEWDQFEWSQRAIHISARKQAKWWYAKRFLHPNIVSAYEYIFLWDEDLGVENFNAEEYLKIVKKHDLDISQPAIESKSNAYSWWMTKRRHGVEVHRKTEEREGKCQDENRPPCAGFVEIMAPVFSRNSWKCVWPMIQNDLNHGWGLDHNFWRCVETLEKIGVVDAQWVEHKEIPSLGDQGNSNEERSPGEAVLERSYAEMEEFARRMEMGQPENEGGRGRILLEQP